MFRLLRMIAIRSTLECDATHPHTHTFRTHMDSVTADVQRRHGVAVSLSVTHTSAIYRCRCVSYLDALSSLGGGPPSASQFGANAVHVA